MSRLALFRARKRRVARQPLRLEPLEDRRLLAGDILITELMASNDSTLQDEDGASPDWFELYNDGAAAVDLNGWHATDDAGNMTKWTFPAVTMDPGEFLVVFASDKDRAVAGSELHTNFRLTSGGEYLAIAEPGGTIVSHEYTPAFPEQFTDVSYGPQQVVSETLFVAHGNAATALFPTAAVDPAWNTVGFDDSGWAAKNLGIGFDGADDHFEPLIDDTAGDVTAEMAGKTSAYVRSTFDIVGDVPTLDDLRLNVNYDDAFVAYLNGTEVARSDTAPASPAWNTPATVEHGGVLESIDLPNFSDGDDRALFSLNGSAAWSGDRLRLTPTAESQGGTAWTSTPLQFGADYSFSSFMAIDVHTPGGGSDGDGQGADGMTFTLQSRGNGWVGNSGGELALDGAGAAFVAVEFDTWEAGSFDPDSSLPTHVGIDTSLVGNVARTGVPRFNGGGQGVNIRYAWVDYDGETDQMDVYFADTATKPGSPTVSATVDFGSVFSGVDQLYAGWTGATGGATNTHDVLEWEIESSAGQLGLFAEEFDISQHAGLLQTGQNVLAVHGMNVSASDSDFLIAPQLSGREFQNVQLETLKYFTEPTPGAPNGEGTDAPADRVLYSLTSRTFVDPFTLTLTVPSPTATIRYTLDGSIPTETSDEYTAPLSINNSTRVRARAFEPGLAPGPVVSESFIALGTTLSDFQGSGAEFDSNLPLMFFESFGADVHAQATNLVPVSGVFIDTGVDGRAGILDEPDFGGRAGMRVRGQTSQNFAKKQYALEIWDEGVADTGVVSAAIAPDLAVSIFGLPAESDWVVNGPYSDKSQLNNYLSFLWSNNMGLYAPRAKLVEAFLNVNGGKVEYDSDYIGTYVLLEKIKIDDNRVDIARLGPTDNAEPEITGGYIWKKDKDGAGDVPFYTNSNQELRHVDPDDGEITPAQTAWLTNHINEFEAALFGANFADPELGYQAFIDVDSWIDTWILVEMTKQIDGFRLSTYYHKDRGGKIKQGPAWDYNLSLSNGNYLGGGNTAGWYHNGLTAEQYPYWPRLFQDENFVQRLIDRWQELRTTVFSDANLLADIAAATALLTDGNPDPQVGDHSNPISRNFSKWTNGSYGPDKHHWPNCYFGGGTCDPSPLGRAPQKFIDYIDIIEWFVPTRAAWMDSQYVARPTITALGNEVTITAPAGEIWYTLDGTDPRSTEPVTINEDTLLAETDEVWAHVPASDVLGTTWTQVAFDHSSWMHGANQGVAYDDNTTYDPYTGLDVTAAMDHVNTSIFIRLPFNVSGDPADYDQLKLYVRYDDGFAAYLNGTQLTTDSNAPATLAYNSTTNGGATHDDGQAVQLIEFDISAHVGLLQSGANVLAIHGLNANSTSSDFLISAELRAADVVGSGLFTPSAVQYTGPFTVSENSQVVARAFDATHAISETTPFSGTREQLVVVDVPPLAITELNYHPAPATAGEAATLGEAVELIDPDRFEFLEIQNVGLDPIDLTGFELSDGVDFTFPAMTLGADEYVLVVRDQPAFEARYGTELNVAGVFEGDTGLSNGGEHVTLIGGVGETIMDFTYDDAWYPLTDGEGFTLTIIDPTAEASTWNDPASWRPSDHLNGTPDGSDLGVTLPDALLINEVVSNASAAPGDRIELFNASDTAIDVSGWYLSDDPLNLSKVQLPTLPAIPPGEFLALDEQTHFPGTPLLSQFGGELIVQATDGTTTWIGFRTSQDYGAAESDMPHGRHVNSDGDVDFPILIVPTLGAANAAPLVGDVVINEMMYAPELGGDEFLELHNTSEAAISLLGWTLDQGVAFAFPDQSIPAGGYALVVGIDPATFAATYGIAPEVPVFGLYSGVLDNAGERVTLKRPGTGGLQIVAESVRYRNTTPWPVTPNGTGPSLSRLDAAEYGNDPLYWGAGIPGGTPGAANLIFDETPPTVPTGLAVTVNDDVDLVLTWDASSDPQSGVDYYVVYRDSLEIGTSATTSFVDTDVTVTVTYTYEVSAVNFSAQPSAPSAPLTTGVFDLASASVVSANQMRVAFTETVEQTSAETTANFLVGGGAVSTATLEPGGTSVLLTTDVTLVDGNGYRVVVEDVAGAAGTLLAPGAEAIVIPGAGADGALEAVYYNNVTFTGPPAWTGTETNSPNMFNRNWTTGPEVLPPGVNDDNISARWTGKIAAPLTGNYTIYVVADDGARLSIDGNTLLDELDNVGNEYWTLNDVPFTADEKVDFLLEYVQNTSTAKVQILWATQGLSNRYIASSAFSVAGTIETAPPAVSQVRVGGHAIPVGSTAQTDPLPYGDLDRVEIAFTEDVQVASGDLTVTGVAVPNYGIAAFDYDFETFTGTWWLDRRIPDDQVVLHLSVGDTVEDLVGNALDGDWIDNSDTYPSGNGSAGGAFEFAFTVDVPAPSVEAQYVFYNGSSLDTGSAAGDDAAIAVDKSPLMPGGTATADNYTNFAGGINGLMVDIAWLAGTPTADDFIFRVGNESTPGGWGLAPPPADVVVRPGEGDNGADRVVVTWADLEIANQWIEVTVKDSAATGLSAAEVFYFGNAIGETGNSASNAMVTAADVIAVRDNPRGAGNRADVTSPYDFNRDQRVDATDQLLARNHVTSPFSALRLIDLTAPAPAPAGDAAEGAFEAASAAVLPRRADVARLANPSQRAGARLAPSVRAMRDPADVTTAAWVERQMHEDRSAARSARLHDRAMRTAADDSGLSAELLGDVVEQLASALTLGN